jgi:hypothetical protein
MGNIDIGSTGGIGSHEINFSETRNFPILFQSFSNDNYYATWIYFTFWLGASVRLIEPVKKKIIKEKLLFMKSVFVSL